MNGLVLGLSCAVLVLCAILVLAAVRIERLMWENREIQADALESDHTKCMAMVAAFVGNDFAARVLEASADVYDSTDGQAALRRIASTVWTEEGDSVPAMWLRERADNMRADEGQG